MNLRCFAFGVASFLFLQASVAQQEMFFDSGGCESANLEAGKGLPVVLVQSSSVSQFFSHTFARASRIPSAA
jgi:hypothetical protein